MSETIVLQFYPLEGAGGEGGFYKVLCWEALPWGPTPYPFIYNFGKNGTPFKYLLLTYGTPFTYPLASFLIAILAPSLKYE